jgi:transposase
MIETAEQSSGLLLTALRRPHMSLNAPLFYRIPDATARVAKAAFPNGNLFMRIRDELGPLYHNQDFAHLFVSRGRPALAPARLALVTVMQFVENLSDAQAADAVRDRLAWKYALALELDDPGFDASVLCEFRTRILDGEAEVLFLDALLSRLRERGLLKARGRQRTDSTYVLATIRTLNRLMLVGETLRSALNQLAQLAPEWLRALSSPEWFKRYSRRVEEYRLPTGKAERASLAASIGADGFRLLTAVYDPQRCETWRRSTSCGGFGSSNTMRQHLTTPPAGAKPTIPRPPPNSSIRPTIWMPALAPSMTCIGWATKRT